MAERKPSGKRAKAKADKAEPAAPAADYQGDDEDPFAYASRRQTELSNEGKHSTYREVLTPEGVPMVIEERGPAGA